MNQLASPRRAWYSGILLSLALLWCTALGPLPARAAVDSSVQPLPGCGTAFGASNCVSVCNAQQHVVAKDLGVPPSVSVPVLAFSPALFDREGVAIPVRAVPTRLAGPPLYLKLHRLLN